MIKSLIRPGYKLAVVKLIRKSGLFDTIFVMCRVSVPTFFMLTILVEVPPSIVVSETTLEAERSITGIPMTVREQPTTIFGLRGSFELTFKSE